MGREVRRVPLDWDHPKYRYGQDENRYMPLDEGRNFEGEPALQADLADYASNPDDWTYKPNAYDYMPCWTPEQAVGYQLYENISEGTPLSPPHASIEALARWLADNGTFPPWNDQHDYQTWLLMLRAGSAPSLVTETNPEGTKVIEGVEWAADIERERQGGG